MKYQVNIAISAGSQFGQEFYVTDPDGSPTDITGATVTAYIAKHAKAVYATDTTSSQTFYNYLPFTGVIEDGQNGVFSLNLTAEQTLSLDEGKYVYSASITDINGNQLGEVVSGIAFVSFSMNPSTGTIGPQTDNVCVGY